MGQRLFFLTLVALLVTVGVSAGSEGPANAANGSGLWVTHGPRGGRALALEASPAFERDGVAFSGEWLTSYRSTESGMGIVRSTDGGRTWAISDAGTEGVNYASAVHDFAFSPDFAADRTVFASTWGGLFKSVDGGSSWTWLEGAYSGPPGAFTTIAVAPDYPDSKQVLAGDLGGLLRSDDGGKTWQRRDDVGAAADIAYAPVDGASPLAFATDGVTVHRSQDAAQTWTTVITAPVTSFAVSPAFDEDRTLFAAAGAGVYASADAGTTWISHTVDAQATVNALAISPQFATDGTLFAAASSGLHWSRDSGETWESIPAYAGGAVRALAISPQWPQHSVLLVGTDAGVYRFLTSDPTSGEVKQAASGFAPLAASPLAWSAEANLLLTATSNHGLYGSVDDGYSWQPMGLQTSYSYYGFSDVEVSPAFSADKTLFAAWLSGTGIGGAVYRSTDSGVTWESVYNTDYVGDLAISPTFESDRTVFATSGDNGLIRSTDGGDSWQEVGAWPGGGANGVALYVALPPGYPGDDTLFVGGAQGFWRLPPGATTWQAASSGITAQHTVISLAVSPDYASDQNLLALAHWPAPTSSGRLFGVFRSQDEGINWHESSTGLIAGELFDVTFSPHFAQDRTAYLSTASGELFRSQDAGQSWSSLGTVYGAPPLYDVVVREDNRIFVGSQAGVWQYVAEPHRTNLPLFSGG